jgi:hypothetical protein
MTKRNHDIIEIAGEIWGGTEAAHMFFDGEVTVWLPKSKCEYDDVKKTMKMPEFLALEKGLI